MSVQVSTTSLLEIWRNFGQKLIEDVSRDRENCVKISNQTLLQWACATGNKKLYDSFVSRKLNAKDAIDFSHNCLELAIAFQHVGIVKRLVDNQNISPVRYQCDGTPLQTAFLLAVETGNRPILEILLHDPRVDPATENSLAIALAITNRDVNILDFLLRGDKIDISVYKYGYVDKARTLMQEDQAVLDKCTQKATKLAAKQQSYARDRFEVEFDMQSDMMINPFDQGTAGAFESFLMQDDPQTDFCYFKRLNAAKSKAVYNLLEKEFDLRGGYIVNILNDDVNSLVVTEIFHPELNIAFANNQAFLYAVKNGRFGSVRHFLSKQDFIVPQKALEIAAEEQNMPMFDLLASDPRFDQKLVQKLQAELMEKLNRAAGQHMAAQREQIEQIMMREQMAAQAQAAALQKSLALQNANMVQSVSTVGPSVVDSLLDAIEKRNANDVQRLIQNAQFDNSVIAENILKAAALQGDARIFNTVSNNAGIMSNVSAQKLQEYKMKAMFAKKNRQ